MIEVVTAAGLSSSDIFATSFARFKSDLPGFRLPIITHHPLWICERRVRDSQVTSTYWSQANMRWAKTRAGATIFGAYTLLETTSSHLKTLPLEEEIPNLVSPSIFRGKLAVSFRVPGSWEDSNFMRFKTNLCEMSLVYLCESLNLSTVHVSQVLKKSPWAFLFLARK